MLSLLFLKVKCQTNGQYMTNKLLVFDFDGTLCDTLKTGLEVNNYLAPRFGFKSIEAKDVAGLRDLSSSELIDFLGIKKIKLPFVVMAFRSNLKKRSNELRLFPGAVELIKTLSDSGCTLGIVSSNSKKVVQKVLVNAGIERCFDIYRTKVGAFKKKRILERLSAIPKQNGVEVVMIGDETRDIQAANGAGIGSVGVTWGFNSSAALSKSNPDYLVSNWKDLEDLLLNL